MSLQATEYEVNPNITLIKFMDESVSFYVCFPLSPCHVLIQCSPYLGGKKEVKSTGFYLIRDSAVLSVFLYNRLKDFFPFQLQWHVHIFLSTRYFS